MNERGEKMKRQRKPSTQINGSVKVGTQRGGKTAGVNIEEINTAKIGEARIEEAHVTLSRENEAVLIEKVIESINTRLGITLDSLKSGEVTLPAEDASTIEATIDEVETKSLPVSPASLYRLGIFAASAKDTEKAVHYFRKATQSDPNYEDAYRGIAWLQQMRAVEEIEKMNLESASELLREASEASIHTKDRESLVQQGYTAKTMAQVAESQGMTKEATAYYKEAASLFLEILAEDPDSAGALNGLGNVYYARGELDEALALFTHAIKLDPDYTAAYHDLAIAYEAKMNADKDHALEWCRKARKAWNRAFRLVKEDPGFSKEKRERILERIDVLDEKCGDER